MIFGPLILVHQVRGVTKFALHCIVPWRWHFFEDLLHCLEVKILCISLFVIFHLSDFLEKHPKNSDLFFQMKMGGGLEYFFFIFFYPY